MSKFKRGDRIKALQSTGNLVTAGKIYEAGGSFQEYYERNPSLKCVGFVDDQGNDDGWNDSYFVLVEDDGPW